MPKSKDVPLTRKPRATTGAAVEDLPPNSTEPIEGKETKADWEQDWELLCEDDEIEFFDCVQMLPEGAWDKLSIYLYRLDPPISNKTGEKKYIALYGSPISQQQVKEQHGGGKFEAYLKFGTRTLRRHKFSIEGQPVLLDGQSARGAGAPAAGGPVSPVLSSEQGIANIVRQVIEATKGDSKAADAGIEVMKRAMMDGLDMTKHIATSNLDSATGNKFGDKLLDSLMPRLLAPPVPDPIMGKFLEAAITMMTKERRQETPAPAPPAADPIAQLGLVKELLGVDSLADLIGKRGGTETPWWVSLLSNSIEKLPTLLAEFSKMQEQGFQRAIIAHQLGAGRPMPLGAMPAPTPASPGVAAGSAPQPAAAPGAITDQMIHAVIEAICRAYDEGYPGDVAGAHVRLLYPQLVESLRPLLADPAQFSSFIGSMPMLAERAKDVEWAEFQQEFVEEIGQVPMPPETQPSTQTAAAVGEVMPSSKPDAGVNPKRKANGRVA